MADVITGAGARRVSEHKPLTQFHLAIGVIVVVAALAVITASLRMTERAIDRAVAQREAARRFFASELSVLRITAMTAPRPVPARLYLGLEECFERSVPVPFESEELGRRTIANCAEIELGRLHAQGGRAMADEGRAILQQIGVLRSR